MKTVFIALSLLSVAMPTASFAYGGSLNSQQIAERNGDVVTRFRDVDLRFEMAKPRLTPAQIAELQFLRDNVSRGWEFYGTKNSGTKYDMTYFNNAVAAFNTKLASF